jgi:hypothetical protein
MLNGDVTICPADNYCPGGVITGPNAPGKTLCPTGTGTNSQTGQDESTDCNSVLPGYYMLNGDVTICPVDNYCPGGIITGPNAPGKTPCPTGTGTNNALGSAASSACVATSNTCSNGQIDAGETDVDCGGPTCPACAATQTCAINTDCLSNVCTSLVCVGGEATAVNVPAGGRCSDGTRCGTCNGNCGGAISTAVCTNDGLGTCTVSSSGQDNCGANLLCCAINANAENFGYLNGQCQSLANAG